MERLVEMDPAWIPEICGDFTIRSDGYMTGDMTISHGHIVPLPKKMIGHGSVKNPVFQIVDDNILNSSGFILSTRVIACQVPGNFDLRGLKSQ